MDQSGAGIPILAAGAWLAALGVFAAAYALGALAAPRAHLGRPLDAILLRFALGLALLPALVLMFGQIEGLVLQRPAWLALPAVGFGALVFHLMRARRDAENGAERRAKEAEAEHGTEDANLQADPGARRAAFALEAAGWLAVGATLAITLGPALSPPLQYDVLEYHLGVVPHYFEAGRIAPIPGIFYSAQPIATEMLYALGAILERTPWGWSSGLVQWGLAALAVACLARASAAWGIPRAFAPWLALLFLAHPIVFKLELDRMTDISGAALAAAGLLLLAPCGAAARGMGAARRALLAGALAGGAAASKWTNAGTVLPMLVFVLLAVHARAGESGERLRACARLGALFALGAALAILPWMMWLWFAAGNPLAPFGANWFPTDAWPPARLAFLLETHEPLRMIAPEYWRNLYLRNARLSAGPPLLPLALLASLALVAVRRRAGDARAAAATIRPPAPAFALAAGIALAILMWGRLRHAQDRFLAPVIAAELLLLGLALAGLARGRGENLRTALAAGLALMALFYWPSNLGAIKAMRYWDCALGRVSARDFIRSGLGVTAELFDAANALPEGSKIMAIGEARRYSFRRSVALSSVFDRPPIRAHLAADSSPEAIRESLRADGFTHLLVNEYELARLADFHPPPLLLKDEGFMRARAGLPPAERRALFAERYAGYAEFGAEPLTDAERAAYSAFLADMRAKASFQTMGARPYPAMWIAPLAP